MIWYGSGRLDQLRLLTNIPVQLERYGVSSRITALAFDPVQSLLAAGVGSSQFGPGQVYILGRNRISGTLPLASAKCSAKTLQFSGDRLLCIDDNGDLTLYSLLDMKLLASYSPPGQVTALACDATLDFALLGLSNGDIMAYDLDRQGMAPFRLPCLWAEHDHRAKRIPVVSLQFHPRDIGKLLVGYWEGAVIFSFKQDEAKLFLKYHLQRGAPGGDGDPMQMNLDRSPRLTHAVWHPTGTFAITAHEDSSLCVWDSREGRLLLARSLTDNHVDRPGPPPAAAMGGAKPLPKTPFVKIAWCAKPDPDDTGLLIAGGTSASMPNKGLTFLELGRTPNYTTSSWQVLSQYFESPKRQHILPTPPAAEVVDFCLIPRKSPWFAGAQDPLAVIALLSSGEITTMSFPSGFPITPVNKLNLSLALVHPFVNTFNLVNVERSRWLGMTETRESGPKFLVGGAEATHPLRRYEGRAVVQTAHVDGTIRIWDAGHGDEIENEAVCQADVCRAVGRSEEVSITKVSLSGASGELAAGLHSGELVVFRWTRNNQPGREPPPAGANQPKILTNVSDRKDPSLVEGFHPLTLLNQQAGPVTAVKVSDVGFVAAGFLSGGIVLIDLRGPAIILNANCTDFAQKEKSHFRKRSNSSQNARVTCLEFSVMMLEGEGYSSILLHAGLSSGQVATFKVIPSPNGAYSAQYVGSSSLDDSIVSICPFETNSGRPALATQQVVGSLRSGVQINGALLVASQSQARIFKPATAKGASKSFDSNTCSAIGITAVENGGLAAVAVFGDGTATAYTLPGLSKIATQRIDHLFDKRRMNEVGITAGGDVIGWTGPSELLMINVWGTGQDR